MTIINKCLAAATAFALAACTLEREDYTEIYPDNFFQTETDLRLAVDGLYYDFNSGDWNGVYSADYTGYQTVGDLSTDAGWCNWGWESDELYFHQWTATTGTVQKQFYTMFAHYNYLSKARNMIRRIEAAPVAEAQKRQWLGEAHALRGWMALYLYDMFGPVPVAPDDVLDDPEKFVYLPRLTDEEYDKMMDDDLLTAIDLLPEMPAQRGRLAKGAARVLLLKYYMMRQQWDKAEPIARDLLAMPYDLQPDYMSVFSKVGIGNNEIILQLPCNLSKSGCVNYLTAECLPGDMPWTEKSTGWGGYVMPWDFYDTFEAKDKRRDGLVESYVNTSGNTVARTGMKYGAVVAKYGKDDDMVDAKSGIDLVIYRYSDVLLSLSEIIVRRAAAPTAEAIALVDRVRQRAGLDPLPPEATATKEAFLDALLLERGHEFYFEGLRRQDLIRFGKYAETANARISKINATEGRGYFNVNDSHNRMPIPQSFINESKSQIKQNPLY